MDLDVKEQRKREEQLRKYKMEKEKADKNFYKNISKKNIYEALKEDGFSYRDIDNVIDDIDRLWDED